MWFLLFLMYKAVLIHPTLGQKSSLLQHYDINPFSEILLGNVYLS